MNGDMILVLDLGSRENERLVQELGELGVYSEVRPHTFTREELDNMPNVKGVIVNGGPNWEGAEVSKEICNAPMPVLLVDHMGDAPWPEDEVERRMVLSAFVFSLCGIETEG